MVNNKLNKLMREYIRSTGHNDTGRLANSISFNLKFTSSGPDFGLKANNYILFLDNGKFMNNFLAQPDVKKVIANFMAEELIGQAFNKR